MIAGPRRRGRSNNGGSYSLSSVLPGISQSLANAVLGDPYAARAAAKEKTNSCGKKFKRPDDLVLEIRRLREQRGMMPKAIEKHLTEIGHPVPRPEIIGLLTYATRGHLVPSEGADPYITPKEKS